MSKLRLGLPSNGRLATGSAELFTSAGVDLPKKVGRSLTAEGEKIIVHHLRGLEIAKLLSEGFLDAGITMTHLIAETGANVEVRRDFDLMECDIVVAAPKEVVDITKLRGRIATSYPEIARGFFEGTAGIEIVEVSGSTEIFPRMGYASGIVDVRSSGATIDENGLHTLGIIMTGRTVLAQRHHLDSSKQEILNQILVQIQHAR